MRDQPAAGRRKIGLRGVRGFTLIELLIALVIAALLAATAYPSYGRYVQRSLRAEAQQLLLEISIAQQQRLLQYGSYVVLADGAAIGSELALAVPAALRDHYAFSVVHRSGDVRRFVAAATPTLTGRMSGEPALTIDEQGNRLPAELW
jgi:type IV pilus assembly protein PilE